MISECIHFSKSMPTVLYIFIDQVNLHFQVSLVLYLLLVAARAKTALFILKLNTGDKGDGGTYAFFVDCECAESVL